MPDGRSTPAEAVIVRATIGPGHDGRAEVVVELAYPNGARTELSMAQESVLRAMDAAELTRLDQLEGRSWNVLTTGPLTFRYDT